MEKRTIKCIINKPGGTASAGAFTYRVTLPNLWVKAMGITKDDREMIVSFDGETITIKKKSPGE